MRTMYDGVTPANLPASALMVAGYINGPYAWTQAEWDRFPSAVKVQISVRAADRRGHVLDVEAGANMPTPADAPAWVAGRRAAGADPTVYCSASSLTVVRAAFKLLNVPEPHYWIAKYDGDPSIPGGAVAKQWLNTAGYDRSSVADYWPGVDPPPAAATTDETEGHMICKATHAPGATPGDDYVAIPCDGKTTLFIATGYGRTVAVKAATAVKDNSGAGVGAYTDMQALGQINPDQPGPIRVGAGCRHVVLRYSADHDFTAWCA